MLDVVTLLEAITMNATNRTQIESSIQTYGQWQTSRLVGAVVAKGQVATMPLDTKHTIVRLCQQIEDQVTQRGEQTLDSESLLIVANRFAFKGDSWLKLHKYHNPRDAHFRSRGIRRRALAGRESSSPLFRVQLKRASAIKVEMRACVA